eukprot:scaffold10797_cov76-Alexandrium_tamarense.AAC.1
MDKRKASLCWRCCCESHRCCLMWRRQVKRGDDDTMLQEGSVVVRRVGRGRRNGERERRSLTV